MKRLAGIILLVFLAALLPAETLGYFSFGFRNDGKRRESHTYVFVDHYQRIVTIILDTNNDWYSDESEVHMYHVDLHRGRQGDATYIAPGIHLVVDDNEAVLTLQGTVTIRLTATYLVPFER